MHDYRNADLDPQTRAMLDFVTRLTSKPTAMKEADVQTLRAHGLSDEQILSVVLITCTFNSMTRLADGLGVEVPDERREYIESWLSGPARRQEWLMRSRDGEL